MTRFRLLLVALSAALVVVLATRAADQSACEDARRGVFAAATGKAPRADMAGHVADVEQRCRGVDALVAAAGAVRTAGDDAEALRLAREATARDPESFPAWRARAALATGGERADAARRGRALDPRWQPPS